MKRFWLSIMAAMLVTAIAVPAFAWEFSMTGEYEFRLRYFSRTGNADLWGDASVQDNPNMYMWDSANGLAFNDNSRKTAASAPGPNSVQVWVPSTSTHGNSNYVGFAGPNIYRTGFAGTASGARPILQDSASGSGVAIVRGGYSKYGSDALYNDMRMTLIPSFQVNNAIRIYGHYTIGGYRNKYVQFGTDAQGEVSPGVPPFERYYMAKSSESALNTSAIGSWEQFRATVQTPIGTLSFGAKDFPFGTGARFSQNTKSDTFVFIMPYGPFRVIYGLYMAEGAKTPYTSYSTVPDKDSKPEFFEGLLIDYNQGPLNVGVAWIGLRSHGNKVEALNNPTTVGQNYSSVAAWSPVGYNLSSNLWGASTKYNNGRFFLNAEYVWQTQDISRLGSYPLYYEQYLWFSEAGLLAGPAKLSLMYAQASGPVKNLANSNQGTSPSATSFYGNLTKQYAAQAINYQVLQPYSFLMFPTYAGGNNAFNADGTGEMSDAIALAARLDYAVAANLNLFGTFLYAKRLEKNGTIAGQYNGSLDVNGALPGMGAYNTATYAALFASYGQQFKSVATGMAASGLNPYVDDDLLGWEVQGGVDWKLLEGLTMNVSYAYWQPGEWFNQAYRAVSGSNIGLLGADMWNTQRSAIQSLRGSFTVNF